MKKILVVAVFLALVLSCCSSSESSPESTVLVTKTLNNPGYLNTYTYDGMKLVRIGQSEEIYQAYSYTGDLITGVKFYYNNATPYREYAFTYNAKKQLSQFLSIDLVEETGVKESYVYNADGTISFTVYTGDMTIQTTLFKTGTILTVGDEVSEINANVFYDGGYNETRTFAYDTKNNPFKNITGWKKLSFIKQDALGFGHNVVTNHYTSNNGSEYEETVTNTYTYNNLNFPVTAANGATTTQYFYNNEP